MDDNIFKPFQNHNLATPQGSGDSALQFPLGEKAIQRLERFRENNTAVIAGQRPVLGGKGVGDKWYIEQLRVMVEKGFTPEHMNALIRRPEPEYTLGNNPVPHYAVFEGARLKRDINLLKKTLPQEERRALDHVRVAGENAVVNERFRNHDLTHQVDSATCTVALPGDFHAMDEILHIVDQKLKGDKSMLKHPLIIENSVDASGSGFWDQLLRGLKILNFQPGNENGSHGTRRYCDLASLGRHLGIYISENRNNTTAILKQVAPRDVQPVTSINLKHPIVPPGSVLFVATGTFKKYKELESICRAQGMDVEVRSIYELVDNYVGPDEDKRTYQGNAAVKMKAAFDAWHDMTEARRLDKLAHIQTRSGMGIKKSQAFFISEDSGFHFLERDIDKADGFNKVSHLLDHTAPFPGVETGPSTIGTDGIRGFMDNVRRIFLERQQQGKTVNYGVVKKSVLALAPVEQKNLGYGEIGKMLMVGSEVRGRVTFDPQPNEPGGALEMDNYLIPDAPKFSVPGAPFVTENRTEAQLGQDFYLYYSPRALAMRALAMETEIDMSRGRAFAPVFSKDFVVGTVVDDHQYAGRAQAEKLEKQAHGQGFGTVALSSRFERPTDLQTKVLSKSDAVVFALDPATAKQDFWQNVYHFTSMIVAEQTHDKYKMTKPFYLVDPDGSFNYLEQLVDDFHHKGTVAEDPRTLYKRVHSMDEALEKLKDDRQHYRRLLLPDYATQEEPFDLEGRETSQLKKDFNVAIFCSATNKNATYMGEARQFADKLIDEGFGLVSGAGMYSMMGQVTEAAHSKRKEPWNAQHVGSSTPNIMPGEGDARKKMTQFLMARNIYERMEYMMDRSDAFAVMVGGTGTVQEFALLCLLKKRALEAGDPYAKEKMEHKEIVVINTPMDTNKEKGFYDKLKEMIQVNDPKAFEQLGIHFVNNREEAMEKMRELREKKRARTGHEGAAEGHEPHLHQRASGGYGSVMPR